MKQKWYRCPLCNKKVLKYEEEANSKGLFIKCKRCKEVIEIVIEKSQ